MGCLFVFGWSRLVAINFYEDETLGVIGLLDDVKTCHAWLPNAVAGVVNRCLAKGVNKFRLYMHVDMDNYHQSSLLI
jgi:hypothetical protein